MPRPAVHVRSLIVALLVAAAFQVGCSPAFGPGFGHATRQVVIVPTVGPIHIRVADDLVNVGIRDLSFLDVGLPANSPAGSDRLAIRLGGREVQTSTFEAGGPVRVRFDSPWHPLSRQTIVFDYDLQPEVSARGIIAAAPDGFAVADRAAFPAWQAPYGIFALGDSRARREFIEITAPADFRVLGPGRERRKLVRGANVVHQFVTLRRDAPAFEIAGKYQEQQVRAAHEDVVFWTFKPLDASQAQLAARRLAAAESTYRKLFDPVRGLWPIRVVEIPAGAPQPETGASDITAASFPGGILLDGRSVTQELTSEPVLERAEYELARTWFGWYVPAGPESESLLGRGMSWYAVTRAAAARGGDAARRDEIARLLANYDATVPSSGSGASSTAPSGAAAQRQIADAYRSALFLVVLEDTAGRDDFDRALRRILRALAGQEIETADLRSALEASTGRDFAQIFRTWLHTAGIPGDFRKRYGSGAQGR